MGTLATTTATLPNRQVPTKESPLWALQQIEAYVSELERRIDVGSVPQLDGWNENYAFCTELVRDCLSHLPATPAPTAMELFNRNVQVELVQKELSISELGRRAGIQQASMSKILSGQESVTIQRAERIAKALGKKLSDLLSD